MNDITDNQIIPQDIDAWEDEIRKHENQALSVYGNSEGLKSAMVRNKETSIVTSDTDGISEAGKQHLAKVNQSDSIKVGVSFYDYLNHVIPQTTNQRISTIHEGMAIAKMLTEYMARLCDQRLSAFDPSMTQISYRKQPLTYKSIVEWMLGDSSDSILNIRKSMLLTGKTGTGKSLIAESIAQVSNYLKGTTFWSIEDMRSQFNKMRQSSSINIDWASKHSHMVLDELHEDHFSKKVYGDTVPWAAEILVARYNLWLRYGWQTIITSNLTATDIVNYVNEERVSARLIEQYMSVEFTGKSLRGL
jgi:DNA replication protein DnaC